MWFWHHLTKAVNKLRAGASRLLQRPWYALFADTQISWGGSLKELLLPSPSSLIRGLGACLGTKSRFLNSGTADIWGPFILCCTELFHDCRVFSIVFGPYVGRDSSTPSLPSGYDNQNVFRLCQMCPSRQDQPQLRSTRLDNAVNPPDSASFSPFNHRKTNSEDP